MASGTLKLNGGIKLGQMASAPSDAAAGLIYYDSGLGEFRLYNGSTFTQIADYSQLGATGVSSGALQIGTATSWSNISPSANNVERVLEAIDAFLGTVSGTTPLDSAFRIENDPDTTKKLAFDVSGVSTATTRTLKMSNFNTDLAALVNANIASGAAIAYSKLNLSASIVNADINGSAAIAYSKLNLSASIVNADIAAGAAIALNKLAALTANRALQSDGSGFISASSVTNTELGYLSGVTSAIQTQLNARALDSAVIKKDGSVAFTGNQSLGGFELTNLADPTSAQSAVTVSYLSARLTGLKPKESVRAATTANGTLASAFANGSVIDGVTLATGDRILIKDQTLAQNNGIYTVNASGAPTRALDFDSLSPVDEVNGSWVAIQEGTSQAGEVWVQFGIVSTLGTDPINFEYFNPIANLIGGDMITFASSTFSVDLATTSGLESSNPGNNAGQLRIKLEGSNPTLKITGSNELAAKLNAAGAIVSGASGLTVNVDGSTIDISTNQIEVKAGGITNTQVSASAAIAYSKLALSNSILNADINASAAIAYSKLNLSASIVNADINGSAAIAYSKLNLSASIVNTDIASGAAIAYSKLALSNSIVNADIATGAAIAYAKLALTGSIVNADVAAGAAIALTKLAALGNHNRALQSDGSGFITESSVTSTELGYVSGVTSAIQTQINTKLSSVSQDTAPTLGGNLAMGGFSIISPLQIADSGSPSRFFTEKYIDATSLTASTTAVASAFTFDSRNFKGAQIFYTILSGSNRRIGRLDIICDAASGVAATSVDYTDVSNETGDVGVTWAVAVNGNNIEASYTTTSGTKTMRAMMRMFQA